MATNRGLEYMGPGKVEVQSIDFPKLALGNRKCEHGVILKIVTTNICGSDQHMVRGRTTAPAGPDARPRDHRRDHRRRAGTSNSSKSATCLRAVQHRLRPLPQLQGRQDRHLPERESRPGPARLTATWIWAAGSAARPST